MNIIKQCSIEHMEAIKGLVRGRNSLMRVLYEEDPDAKAIRILSNPSIFVFGKFDGEELISIISAYEWPGLPYYTIDNLYVKAGYQKFFSLEKSGFADILTKIVCFMEERGRFTFYFVRAHIKKWVIRDRNLEEFRRLSPEFNLYDYTIEEVVEPNMQSKYKAHRELLGNVTRPIKTVVIRCTLPDRLRTLHETLTE